MVSRLNLLHNNPLILTITTDFMKQRLKPADFTPRPIINLCASANA